MSSTIGVKSYLQTVAARESFSADDMAEAVAALTADGTPAQMAAFLMGMRVRGETVEEITGARARHAREDAPPSASRPRRSISSEPAATATAP